MVNFISGVRIKSRLDGIDTALLYSIIERIFCAFYHVFSCIFHVILIIQPISLLSWLFFQNAHPKKVYTGHYLLKWTLDITYANVYNKQRKRCMHLYTIKGGISHAHT